MNAAREINRDGVCLFRFDNYVASGAVSQAWQERALLGFRIFPPMYSLFCVEFRCSNAGLVGLEYDSVGCEYLSVFR